MSCLNATPQQKGLQYIQTGEVFGSAYQNQAQWASQTRKACSLQAR